MDYQEIKVVISKDGKVELEVNGVKGMSCMQLTEALEAALGNEIMDREMKPDAYEQSASDQQFDWLSNG